MRSGPARKHERTLPSCRFDEFVLDGALCELRRAGRRVAIEPQALNLLGVLIRHRDRVVSKDELLAAVWPCEFVSDDALTYCIKAARKAVGDSGAAQRFIATVRSRGYRFVAAIDDMPAAVPPARAPAPDAGAGFYVGREAAMAQAQGALTMALSGRGRLVLIEGEPGIGKTRTAEEVGAAAVARGARVLVGRCHESPGAPAFWPWVQVVRAALDGCSPADGLAMLGRGAADVARIAPEIALWPGAPAPAGGRESPQARFRVFDSVAGFLTRLATAAPLVVVLDDLHWADKPSLLLLQFLARELASARLLLIGTFRDVDLGAQQALVQALGDLARSEGAQRIVLEGLGAQDIGRLIEATTGIAPAPSLAETLREQTGGNPFFVSELVRLLAAEAAGALRAPPTRSTARTGAPVPIPRNVREAVLRRTERLSAGCRRILRLASVLGREIDLAVLIEAARHGTRRAAPGPAVLDGLDEAAAARLVEPISGLPATHRFTHALVAETLYTGLPARERAHLHAAAGAAIEAVHRVDLAPHVAALAHHFGAAAPLGGKAAVRAAVYARRAGDDAARTWAYEEAAVWYERALALAGGGGAGIPAASARERQTLLLALGENLWKAGEFSRAKAIFQRAAGLARSERAPRDLALAALGYGGGFRGFELGVIEPELISLLEESIGRLHRRPSALLARVMARLAVALYHVPGSLERRRALSRDAVRMAERSGDPAAHLAALYSRHWAIWGPDDVADRLATAQAMRDLAVQVDDREMALHAHRFHLIDALQLGDRDAVDADLAACTRLADELRQPYYQWYAAYLQAMRALLDGRVADSERLAATALAIGGRAQSDNVGGLYAGQMLYIRREQGRVSELEPAVRAMVDAYPRLPSWRGALAYTLAVGGRHAEAQAQIDLLAENDFAAVPRNVFWLLAMGFVADACATISDAVHAPVVYRLLDPYGDLLLEGSIGAACLGSVARLLGRLAALLQRWPEADTQFERALAAERRLGAPHLIAHTQRDYAAALLARGDARLSSRAADLLRQAHDTYERLGMGTHAAALAGLRERTHSPRGGTAAKHTGPIRLVR